MASTTPIRDDMLKRNIEKIEAQWREESDPAKKQQLMREMQHLLALLYKTNSHFLSSLHNGIHDDTPRSMCPFGGSFVFSAGRKKNNGYRGPRGVDIKKDYVVKNAKEEAQEMQKLRDKLAEQNRRYRSVLRDRSLRSRLTQRERESLKRLSTTTTTAVQNLDKRIAELQEFK